MGCQHSKTSDVIEGKRTEPPAIDASGKTSMDIVNSEIVADEMSKSVPPVEKHDDRTVVAHGPEVAITSPVAAPAHEGDEALTKAKQQQAHAETGPEPNVTNALLPVATTVPVQDDATPVGVVGTDTEPLVASETTVEQEVAVPQDHTSLLEREKAVVTSASASPPVWTFVAETISFTVGVAYYNISGSTAEGDEVLLTKRYSEFKLLHAEMTKVMTAIELPRLPGASFLQGRNDKTLLRHREAAFVQMLNAIAQHPDASTSASFTAFLA
ncbi:unnamed protein product [Hyaloperonospora brassicae]|uniref:PX domain-containing protein n=1 Tax=Hyaloperonospora brassicae TaxID=162125 RepID=A0AAV0TWD4_HYABA|nr:unnamed protein product [Hyaloperonospora brassicae]